MTKNCLNCNAEINLNFCPNCGQKTSVHQYSVKHFIEHDLIHGIFHVDKGFLYTIKMLFTAPGHSIREFIEGKRVNIFNFVTLLVIIIGVSHFISSYSTFKLSDIMPDNSEGFMKDFEGLNKKYPKLILLMTIPFYSIFTFFWFKKTKLNLTEHFVLNSYKTAGELSIATIFTTITVFYTNTTILGFIYAFTSFGTYLYSIWFYRQFFTNYGFSRRSLLLRSILSVLSYLFLSVIIGIIIGLVKLIKHYLL